MSRLDDAFSLVSFSREQLEGIQLLHDECLREEVVKPQLQIEVKSFLEHLRSALDYCACELFDRFGDRAKSLKHVYFPCVTKPEDRPSFHTKFIKNCIPGLVEARPDLVLILESYQAWGHTGNWLATLHTLVNEHKHQRLVPQKRDELKVVQLTGTIKDGNTIHIDLTKIKLGHDPQTGMTAVAGDWVGLSFDGKGPPIMFFFPNLPNNVENVLTDVRNAI